MIGEKRAGCEFCNLIPWAKRELSDGFVFWKGRGKGAILDLVRAL